MHPHSGTGDYHRSSQAHATVIPMSTSMFQTYTAAVPQKTAQVQPQADLVPGRVSSSSSNSTLFPFLPVLPLSLFASSSDPHSGTGDYHRSSEAHATGIPMRTSMFQTYTAAIPQKTAQVQPQADLVSWSSGFFDCTDDVGNYKSFLMKLMCFLCTAPIIQWLISLIKAVMVSDSFGGFNFSCSGCITMWLPCITFGQIAEIVDRGRFYKLELWVTACATSGLSTLS